MKLRRNDVVLPVKKDIYQFYGRVNRVLGDQVEIIDCGKHVFIAPMADYEKVDYKGYWESELSGRKVLRYLRMPTLRKLKQWARRYNPQVWKKNQKRRRLHNRASVLE